MTHEELLQAAKDAADALHGDTRVPLRKTIDSLQDLAEHLDSLIEATEADLAREEK